MLKSGAFCRSHRQTVLFRVFNTRSTIPAGYLLKIHSYNHKTQCPVYLKKIIEVIQQEAEWTELNDGYVHLCCQVVMNSSV